MRHLLLLISILGSAFGQIAVAQSIQCTVSVKKYTISQKKLDGRTWDTQTGTVAPDPAFTIFVNNEEKCSSTPISDRYTGTVLGACSFSFVGASAPRAAIRIEDKDVLYHDLIGDFPLYATDQREEAAATRFASNPSIEFVYSYTCR